MHDKASFCIEFDDAGVSRGGHIIWQHGTFRIPQGSVTAIVGTNGAGKTTMMKAELGLIPIAHGDITVLGKPAGDMNHRIGYVPQSYASDIESNITAEQSVLLGLTGARFGIHPITRLQKDEFFANYDGRCKKTILPSYEYLRWKEGLYCFDDVPFSGILDKLEKYYNVKISVTSPRLLTHEGLTGKFREQDGIEHILRTISKEHPFKFSINEAKDSIIIYE